MARAGQNRSRQARRQQSRHRLMVDSSAFMALEDPDDQYHSAAKEFRENFILQYKVELFSTSYIHSEVMSHLTHLNATVLSGLDTLIRDSPATALFRVNHLSVNEDTIKKAMPIYFQYLDQDFSVTDCTSFVLMQENAINVAFTFDDDYKMYSYRKGYEPFKRGFWKLPEMLEDYLRSGQPYVIVR
jgi:predicted nucleic acid-binding protein